MKITRFIDYSFLLFFLIITSVYLLGFFITGDVYRLIFATANFLLCYLIGRGIVSDRELDALVSKTEEVADEVID